MPRLSLKWRLTIFACAFATMVLATEVYNDLTFRRYRIADAFEDASTTLSILKSEVTRMTGGVKNLLVGIAADAPEMTHNEGGCRHLEAVIKGRYMNRLRLWVLDSQNRVLCATDPADLIPSRALAAARDATVSREPGAGQLVPAGEGHGPALPLSRPWEAADGRSGSVLALIDLLWMEDVYSHRPLPDIASGSLIAANGTLLMSWPQLKDGTTWSDTNIGDADGTSTQWQDGLRRFTKAALVDASDLPGIYAVAGVDAEKALAPFARAEARTWAFGLLSLLACIAVAMWSLNRTVLRPIQIVIDAARRIGSGDRSVTIAEFGTTEIRALVNEINEMARALEEAETLQQAAKHRAEEADRAKTRFLAATSHDLRQPLQAASLFAEMLATQTQGTPSAKVCAKLQASLTALNSLLNALLDTAQMESGAVQPNLTDFSISALLDEIQMAYTPIAAAKGLSFTVVASDVCVRSDRVLLARMIRNLVENALRYTGRGRVMLDCFSTNTGELSIEVRDTGIGIPKEKFSAVWEEFTQLSNPERKREGGLGLGLSIVRKLSVALGHTVAMNSQLGSGSTFTIVVPVVSVASEQQAEPHRIGPCLREGTKVLVIEDDDGAADGLQGLLQSWGALCEVAIDGRSAVDHVRAFRPDLVISDYRLPGMNGASAIRAVRDTLGGSVPAIILTGDIGDSPEQDAAVIGAELLRKPTSPNRLGAACRSALSMSA